MAPPDARAVVADRVSRETLSRLDAFEALLIRWQSSFNLVGPRTLSEFWDRHVLDSLQLVDLAPATALRWTDIGSGAGFPGLVLAATLCERPASHIRLIEPNHKRAAFLREVARAMIAPVSVVASKVEDAPVEPCDIVTARAVAPLVDLLGMAQPYLAKGAEGLFLKGQDIVSELTQASRYWNIQAEIVPSRSDERGRILVVKEVRREPASSPDTRRGKPEGWGR